MEPRNRTSVDRVYEDFEPKMEWEREPAVDTLSIILPGFRKEQMKVQVTSSRFLRVSGERQLSDNKWSRFRKEIPIESNYDANEISAKFEKGILRVSHPKFIVQEPPEQPPQSLKPPQGNAAPPMQPPPKPQQEKTLPPPKLPPPPKPRQQPQISPAIVEQPTVPLGPKKPPQEKAELPPTKPPQKPQKPPPIVEQPTVPSVPEIPSLQEKSKQQMESEKPTNEKQEKKNGIDRQKSGKSIDRKEDSSNTLQKMFEKEKEELGKFEQKDKNNEVISTDEGKQDVTVKPKNTANNGDVQNNAAAAAAMVEKNKLATTTTQSTQVATEIYKRVFSDMVKDLKNPRDLLSSILVALQVLIIALYLMIMKAIRSLRKSDK